MKVQRGCIGGSKEVVAAHKGYGNIHKEEGREMRYLFPSRSAGGDRGMTTTKW